MEARRQDLGIISFGASVTTLEDVFLEVGKEVDGTLNEGGLMGVTVPQTSTSVQF